MTDQARRSVIFISLYALIALFVHILRNPTATETASDLALMNVAVGYFSRLELATDMMFVYQFIQDATSIARFVVDRAKSQQEIGSRDHAIPNTDVEMLTSRLDDSRQHLPDPLEADNRHNVGFCSPSCDCRTNRRMFEIADIWSRVANQTSTLIWRC